MFHKKDRVWYVAVLLGLSATLTACSPSDRIQSAGAGVTEPSESVHAIAEIPEYGGMPYVEINDNEPEFTESEITTVSYEEYSDLDFLGRCGPAEACIGGDLMPDAEREDISSVEPTGWENKEYDIVDGGYIYNRCHLIGFQLTGENANEENLITGTRYMNTEGMLPFENRVAEYVQETDNHVMYRVTPVFEGNNLLASGVQMEAESVEDGGTGICFNIYVYNVQPRIAIDYSTGANWLSAEEDRTGGKETSDSAITENKGDTDSEEHTYILNNNTKKFHNPDCSSVDAIRVNNKSEFTGIRGELIQEGYAPCGRCRP